MNKVLSVAALLALATASEDFTDFELNLLSKIKDDVKKAGHFVVEHPQIITTAAKILARDDEIVDDELNAKDVLKKIGKGLLTGAKIASKFLDNEMTENELNVFSHIKDDLKKAGHFVAEHPEIVKTAIKLLKDDEVADEELLVRLQPLVDRRLNFPVHIADDELIHLPKPKIDVHIGFDELADDELNAKDVFKKIGQGLLTGAKIASKFLDDEAAENELHVRRIPHFDDVARPVKDCDDADDELLKIPKPKIDVHIGFDDMVDDELNVFSKIKEKAKKAANWVGDHPQVISEAAKAAKILKKDDEVADDELIHLPKPKVGVHIGFDELADDELNAKDVFKKIGQGILTGAKIASKFLDDEVADDELIHLPKPKIDVHVGFDDMVDDELNVFSKIKEKAKKAVNWVGDHPQVISEAAKAAKILKKDDEIADDELNAKDVFKKIGKGLLTGAKIASKFLDDEAADDELIHLPKPKVGVHIGFDEMADDELNAKDVFKKIGKGLLTGAKIASKFLDDEAAENELNVFSHIKDDLKKAANWVGDHPQVISEAAKAAKLLKKDDEVADDELIHLPKPKIDVHIGFDDMADDELSNLGALLHEGRHIQKHHQRNHTIAKPIKKISEVHDHNLSIKDKLKKAAGWVGDHPQVISEAAKAAKLLRGKH